MHRAAKLLDRMSSFWYVFKSGQSLVDKVTSAENEILDAMQAFPATPATYRDNSAATREQQRPVLQREQSELAESLKKAKGRQSKARQLFERDVSSISDQALHYWVTDCEVVVDEASKQAIRFGHLFWAFFDEGTVQVQRVGMVEGSSNVDAIKRVKAHTHWMRHCESIMLVQNIKYPDLIIYGAAEVIPLPRYLAEMTPSLDERWKIAHKMAGALSYVHESNVIHRNVRADSVFMVRVEPSGAYEPKLAGFEICRSDNSLSIGQENESDPWLAPERRDGHGSSPKTDVFAFGVLMYEIIMGRPPRWVVDSSSPPTIRGKTEQNVAGWIVESAGLATEEYAALMQSCLAYDYEKRPKIAEVCDILSNGYSPDKTAYY
ncbi:hypothetical protein DFQ27_000300 [Actinomortierella ambigua]|uniref:Protein kinase domain-containing protein n=1 Tax=Actinomortierella ambigua TaxID=1343610 RepID=A0A9P6TWH0_9FUNG|nr:hypothetical protein DFQ27_000300 [Actinomortierella ambigua]